MVRNLSLSHRSALKTRRITRPSKIYEKETMDRETRNGNIARLNRARFCYLANE